MIALFDGDPHRVTLSPTYYDPVGLLLGLALVNGFLSGVIVFTDGQIGLVPVTEFTIDWRYLVEKDAFFDLEAIKAGETEVEEE